TAYMPKPGDVTGVIVRFGTAEGWLPSDASVRVWSAVEAADVHAESGDAPATADAASAETLTAATPVVQGTIGGASDTEDVYRVHLAGGQTLSVRAIPTSDGLDPSVKIDAEGDVTGLSDAERGASDDDVTSTGLTKTAGVDAWAAAHDMNVR